MLLVSLIALLALVPTPGAAQGAPNATPTVTPPLFYGDFSFSFNPAVIPSFVVGVLTHIIHIGGYPLLPKLPKSPTPGPARVVP